MNIDCKDYIKEYFLLVLQVFEIENQKSEEQNILDFLWSDFGFSLVRFVNKFCKKLMFDTALQISLECIVEMIEEFLCFTNQIEYLRFAWNLSNAFWNIFFVFHHLPFEICRKIWKGDVTEIKYWKAWLLPKWHGL